MNKDELKKILKKHEAWLMGEDSGGRANLYGADLRGANLREANLREADLYGADLRRANLYGADLRRADLYGANLRRANLREANLREANLREANLYGADLRGANLRRADLRRRANLYGADLRGANLREANLREADLYGAELYGAELYGADLYSTVAMFQCPEEGAFTAWKKCRDGVIVKLLIPEDAKRSSATTRKCRASKAVVLEVFGAEEGVSTHDNSVVYRKGEALEITNFDDNRWNECATGIHFFITRKEAEDY